MGSGLWRGTTTESWVGAQLYYCQNPRRERHGTRPLELDISVHWGSTNTLAVPIIVKQREGRMS